MSTCINPDLGMIRRIYAGFRDPRSNTQEWLFEMWAHLVGQDGENLILDLSQRLVLVESPSASLQQGDLLVDPESEALLQITDIAHVKQVTAQLLEPHPQMVMDSGRFIRELAERITSTT